MTEPSLDARPAAASASPSGALHATDRATSSSASPAAGGAGSGRNGGARHLLTVLVVRGFGAVAGVLATLVASRMLGADAVGIVSLALTIVTVLATVSRLGMDSALVRFIGMHAAHDEWGQVKGVFGLAQKWSGRASLGVALVLFLSAGVLAQYVFHKPELAPVLRIMAWLLPLMASYWLCAQALIGVQRPELATALQNICLPAGFACLLVVGLATSVPIPHTVLAATAYTLAGLGTCLLALVLWRSKLPAAAAAQAAEFDGDLLRRTAAALWVSAVMNQVVTWSGQIASGAWVSATGVAHLAVAQRSAVLISLVLMVTNMLVAPRFAAMYRQGKVEELRQLARRAVRSMTLVVTPVVLLVMVAADPLMRLFGPDFAAGAPLLRVLVFGQWVNVVTGSVIYLLQMTGHERDMRNIAVLSGMFSIFMAVVLTASYGALGAAWATTLAVIMQNVAALLMVRRRLGFFVWGLG